MSNHLKKSISVVLPNYNGRHLLEQYIPSVMAALQFSQVDYEFIVIDDCSNDDSFAFIAANYPSITLLKNAVNSGFSKTCNHGIFKATKELIFLVNSDVKVSENYFEHQFQYFNLNDTFGVMGCIMNFDGKKIEDAARLPRYKGAKFKANTFYYIENTTESVFTTYLSGANALVDAKKLKQLNGFDEIYSPFYFEDFDLGLRAWQMGWKCYYEHQSVCYHRVSASTDNMNKSNFVKITYNRNSFFLQAIHLQGFRKILWFFQLYSTTLLSHFFKGEFWIFSSLSQFANARNQLELVRHNFEQQKVKAGSKINLDTIIKLIEKSIANKNIKWL